MAELGVDRITIAVEAAGAAKKAVGLFAWPKIVIGLGTEVGGAGTIKQRAAERVGVRLQRPGIGGERGARRRHESQARIVPSVIEMSGEKEPLITGKTEEAGRVEGAEDAAVAARVATAHGRAGCYCSGGVRCPDAAAADARDPTGTTPAARIL